MKRMVDILFGTEHLEGLLQEYIRLPCSELYSNISARWTLSERFNYVSLPENHVTPILV